MLKRRLSIAVACLLVLFAASTEAQVVQGGIRGIVKDETGGLLVGVTVEAESPARIGPPAVTVTNHIGLYRFEGLPVGVYTVTFTLPGFTTIRRENVDVPVGRTIDLDMTLTIAGAEETVTVTAASPVIDTVHADYSTNFAQELVKNVPTTRNSYFDIVTSVPGVKAQHQVNISNFSIYGSNQDQNSFQYDGVDVSSVSSGGPWDYPNYDMIQEIEVLGVGASAEFSGFQGGVINILSKSGSNSFNGVASYFLVDDWMVGNNTPEEEFPTKTDYRRDFTFQLGGPIIQDRLWFIFTFQDLRFRGVPIGIELTPEVPGNREDRPSFKITSQLSDKDNLEFFYTNNFFDTANAPSITRPVEATDREHGDAPVISLRWTHLFGANTLMEVKGGGIYIRDGTDPVSGDFDTPGHNDVGTGISSVNNSGAWRSHQNKTQLSASLTHYADDFIKGSHDFKFGAQFLRSLDSDFWRYIGDVYYYDYYGERYYAVYRDPYGRGASVDNDAVFINDNWTISDRVTLNLGVRYDHMTGGIPDVNQRGGDLTTETGVVFPGKGTLITFNNVSPRLGLTVKIDEEGKTVGKASFGRYYGKIAGSWLKPQSEGNTIINAYFYNEDTGLYDIPYWSEDPAINIATDPNLRNQYTDQFFAGIEREIVPEVRLDVSFIHKKEHDFVRVKDVGGEYVGIPFVDAFRGKTQTLTVYNRASPWEQSLYMSTNRDDFKQDYNAFVIQANKRWSHGWTLNGSYQWQRGKSMGRTASFTTQGARGFGADPNDMINAYGRSVFDSTHTVKLSTAFELPYGITTGIRYTYEDGRPLPREIDVRGLSQGRRTVTAEPRGAYKLDTVHDLSLRLDKDFRFWENRRLRFSFDVFNALNMANATNVRYNSTQAGEDFLQKTEVPGPRRAQFGVRFEF